MSGLRLCRTGAQYRSLEVLLPRQNSLPTIPEANTAAVAEEAAEDADDADAGLRWPQPLTRT